MHFFLRCLIIFFLICCFFISSDAFADILVGGGNEGTSYTTTGDITHTAGSVYISVNSDDATSLTISHDLEHTTNSFDFIKVDGTLTTMTIDEGASVKNTAGGDNTGAIVADGTGGEGIITTVNNNGSIEGNVTGSVLIENGGQITTFNNAGTIRGTRTDAGSSFALSDAASKLGLNNTGTITSAFNNFGVGGQLTSFSNTGVIESTNTSNSNTTALRITEEQTTITITNDGTIRHTDGGVALRILTADQTSKDFINNGTISSATGRAVYGQTSYTGETDGFVNASGGTISTGGATAMDLEAAWKIKNDGTITGAIDHTTAGTLTLTNSGTITGAISSTVNAAHSFTQTAGNITGDITLNGTTANTFSLDGGTITGNVDLGNNAGHSVELSAGTITGSFDMGDTAGGTATADPASGQMINLSNTGSTAFTGEQATLNMTGAGILNITGNMVDASGGGNDLTLDIDAGTVNIVESASIDGGIDADGGALDVDDNVCTVKSATDFASGATLATKIDGATIGSITNGASDITIAMNNGAVIDVNAANLQSSTTYTVVNATGASGGSNLTATAGNITVNDNVARYTFALAKSGDTLTLTPTLVTTGVSSPVNQVVDDAFAGDSTLNNALNNIATTSALNSALETLEPDVDVIKNSTMVFQSRAVKPIENRISSWTGQGVSSGDVPFAQGVWAQTFADYADQDNRGGAFGYDSEMQGIAVGYDREWGQEDDKFLLGGSYSHVWADVDVNAVADSIDIQGDLLTGYGTWKKDGWIYDALLSYGYNQYEGKRVVTVGAVERVARSDFDGHQFAFDVDISRHIQKDGYVFIPTVGLKHSALYTQGYDESGAGSANLSVESDWYNRLYAKAGLAVEKTVQKFGLKFQPRLTFNILYDLLDEDVSSTATFQGGGSSFSVDGLKPDRELFVVGAEMNIAKTKDVELNIVYDYSWNDSYESNYVAFKVRVDF